MLRIAHFVHRYPPALGGAEAYFARLSRYLVSAGEEVSVFTTTAFDLSAFWSPRGRCLPGGVTDEDGVSVHRYPLWRFHGQRYFLKALSLLPLRDWQALTISCNPIAPGMWRDASQARGHFDVVHATALPYAWPLLCARRLARRLGVPFIVTPFLHTGDPDDPRDRTRRAFTRPALLGLLQSADCLFVQTETERDALLGCGINPNRLVLQGMGVDEDSCTGGNRAAARAAWQVREPVVGHLANNSVEKGTVDLLRAAEIAWYNGARFTVVLAGPTMPNFERFWKSFGSKERVRRLGVLDERQKRDFFAGLDVFALPSRHDSFGIVLLEAWANGVPNVGYRAGGIASLIQHDSDGLLVRCGDVGGLAVALGQLSADGPLRRRLGEAGRQRLGRDFRWVEKLALVSDTYRSLAQEKRRTKTDAKIMTGVH
jgi:glycosyltransferase involved in cell wall biosynthesis